MYKIYYDADGNITRTRPNNLSYTTTPAESFIEISQEQYNNYLAKKQSYKIIDGVFTYIEPTQPSLEDLKTAKWQEIKQARDNQEQAGLPYMGKVLDSDTLSVQRLTTAAQVAQLAISQNQEFTINWTTKDNSTLTMTAQQVLEIPKALVQYNDDIHNKARLYKEKIDKATTAEKLAKIVWE